MVAVAELVVRVEQAQRRSVGLEGVTVLGGEPFDQPEALADFFESVRPLRLSTMVYTGHLYESLRANGSAMVQRLLRATDVLVDGPFLAAQYSGELAWRGSANQRLICLTRRYTSGALEDRYAHQRKAFSLHITPSGLISLGGLQERKSAKEIESSMRLSGLFDRPH